MPVTSKSPVETVPNVTKLPSVWITKGVPAPNEAPSKNLVKEPKVVVREKGFLRSPCTRERESNTLITTNATKAEKRKVFFNISTNQS